MRPHTQLLPVVEPILRPIKFGAVLRNTRPDSSTGSSMSLSARIRNVCLSYFRLGSPHPANFSPPGQDLVLYHGVTYVPPDDAIRSEILSLAYDSIASGHPGCDRTIDLVRRSYNWPGLPADVRRYVSSCDSCQKSNATHPRPQGSIKPLPIPDRPWSSITWDSIGPLPLSTTGSSTFDTILVIVDRFTKLAHFVPANTTDSSRSLAHHFMRKVFRLHGLPNHIISDRGPTFSSAWCKEFCSLLGPEIRLSTAFHPQIDGQTERTNQSVEHYLPCFVNYLQTDWSTLLDTAEFAYNNATHLSTSQTPFMGSYGYHPLSPLEQSSRTLRVVPDAHDLAARIAHAPKSAKSPLALAADRMSALSASHRSPAPVFRIGDMVLVMATNIRTTRPSKKLDDKNIGPFRVTLVLGSHNYRLDLGDRTIHSTFHVDRLLPYIAPDSFSGRPRLARPPPETIEQNVYEVDEIVDSRRHREKLQFFVRWKGYGSEDMQWVSATDFHHDDSLVLSFVRRHPTKPVPALTRTALLTPSQESHDTVMDQATQRIPIQIDVYCRNAPILEIVDS